MKANMMSIFVMTGMLVLQVAIDANAKRLPPFTVEKTSETEQNISCAVHFLAPCEQVSVHVRGIDGAEVKEAAWSGTCQEVIELQIEKASSKTHMLGKLVFFVKVKKNSQEESYNKTLRLGHPFKKLGSPKDGVILLESIEGPR